MLEARFRTHTTSRLRGNRLFQAPLSKPSLKLFSERPDLSQIELELLQTLCVLSKVPLDLRNETLNALGLLSNLNALIDKTVVLLLRLIDSTCKVGEETSHIGWPHPACIPRGYHICEGHHPTS